jgi:hypothetical protein
MQPQTPTPAPGYIWVAYPALSTMPFIAHGAAATLDDAREEAEDAMTERPGETDFAVILAHDSDDMIGRRVGDGAYQWAPYRLAGLQPS